MMVLSMTRSTPNLHVVAGIIIFLFLSACTPKWALIEKANEIRSFNDIEYQAPMNWMMNNPIDQYVKIERNGRIEKYDFNLVSFTYNGWVYEGISLFSIDQKDAFPYLKRSITSSTPIEDVAELYIAEHFKTDNEDIHFIEPINIDGQHGFRIVMEYRTSDAIQFKKQTIGFVYRDKLYVAMYGAPTANFYSKYESIFNEVVASIRLK